MRLLAAGAAIALAAVAYADAPDLGSDAQRASGKVLYEKFCTQCHGEAGDGAGPAAVHLKPLPRNFTTGKFKIRTTPSGAPPTTADLKHIIKAGMPYTSMPPWPNFTDEELSSLAYYVKSFSPDFAKADFIKPSVDLPKAPAYSKESAEKGRKVYEDTGCISCHGDLGRGDGASAKTLLDDLGHHLKPADFTQRWTFRGGPTREDIFRTMTTGLNGTPMPAFGDALKPEERWQITDYMYSLGSGDEPGYASLIHVKHVDDTIDLTKGAAAFDGAPVARLPILGQIDEPGREFHPPVASIQVQAIYDAESIALLIRWNDMSAETVGSNSPAIVVPVEDEAAGEAAPAAAATDEWGEAAAPAAGAAAAPAAPTFSDALAVQVPVNPPSGPRKPYFVFGDAANSVDLWFVDLAKGAAAQFTGKGSGAVEPSEAGDVTATAHYEEGEWSVILKRPLHVDGGVTFAANEFVPVAFSVWDGFSQDRGNKRGLTAWFYLYVEPEQVLSAKGPMMKAGLGVLALELLVIALVRRKSKQP